MLSRLVDVDRDTATEVQTNFVPFTILYVCLSIYSLLTACINVVGVKPRWIHSKHVRYIPMYLTTYAMDNATSWPVLCFDLK